MSGDAYTFQLYIVRHAQSLSNAVSDGYLPLAEAPLFEKSDPPLSGLGEAQAKAVGERFRHHPLNAILASPYCRARQTAAEIQNYHPQIPVTIEPDAVEIDTLLLPDGGFGRQDESDEAGQARAVRLLEKLRQTYRGGENVLLVTHAVFSEFLVNAAFDVVYRPNRKMCFYNTAVSKLKFYRSGLVKIALLNDTAHLAELEGDRIFTI